MTALLIIDNSSPQLTLYCCSSCLTPLCSHQLCRVLNPSWHFFLLSQIYCFSEQGVKNKIVELRIVYCMINQVVGMQWYCSLVSRNITDFTGYSYISNLFREIFSQIWLNCLLKFPQSLCTKSSCFQHFSDHSAAHFLQLSLHMLQTYPLLHSFTDSG